MVKFYKSPLRGFMYLSVFLLVLNSCKKDDSKTGEPQTLYGEEISVGEGTARSFIINDNEGNPETIGFTFTAATLNNLMHSKMFEIPVPAGNNTMVDHISFDFNAHGHEPPGIYDVPHFDVHFYNISKVEREAISNTGPEIEILPASKYIPVDYAPIPGGDAKMGKHWTDTTGHEFHSKAFDKTFIYGSYNGKFIFHEAMIALSYLQTKPNITMDVKQQPMVQVDGYYPGKFSVLYDQEKKMYTISLDAMRLRAAE